MTLRTYCLRGDKVLNVSSLFSRVDHTRSLYGSAVYFFITLSVSQADQSQAYKFCWQERQVGFHAIRGI